MGYDEPGLKKLPCPGPNELRPNMQDAQPERGVLAFARPNQMVQDYGALAPSPYPWSPPTSPARADHTPGVPSAPKAEQKDKTPWTIVPGKKRH